MFGLIMLEITLRLLFFFFIKSPVDHLYMLLFKDLRVEFSCETEWRKWRGGALAFEGVVLRDLFCFLYNQSVFSLVTHVGNWGLCPFYHSFQSHVRGTILSPYLILCSLVDCFVLY